MSSVQIDRPTIIRSFNDYFFEFLDDMLKVLPNNKSVLTAIRSFRMLTDVNKGILIKCWHKFVYLKYKNVIDEGNIEFFFEKDYSEDLTKLSNANTIMEIIDSVRIPAKEICENPKNKEHITTYIQTLCKLSEILNDMNE
jgi:hypothetical protein